MATIEDLKIPSITDISQDGAIEYLRQLRLSRRTPIKRQTTTTAKKKKQAKITKNQAADLLKLLEGK